MVVVSVGANSGSKATFVDVIALLRTKDNKRQRKLKRNMEDNPFQPRKNTRCDIRVLDCVRHIFAGINAETTCQATLLH
jgi:hypothetical protein